MSLRANKPPKTHHRILAVDDGIADEVVVDFRRIGQGHKGQYAEQLSVHSGAG